jgi:signal transduction histidine kinase
VNGDRIGFRGSGRARRLSGLEPQSSQPVSARIIAAADDVRRRIERDLHDSLQHRLLTLGVQVRLAEASVEGSQQELRYELARIAEGMLEVLESVREVSRGIYPAILSRSGLGPAVRALARRSPVPVRLHLDVESRMPDRVEVGAYYILSEALANAARHAEATVVDISVAQRGRILDLSVRDDGIGGADDSGVGLTGLADRVRALTGTMRLVSPRGHGTRLRVRLPIRPVNPDRATGLIRAAKTAAANPRLTQSTQVRAIAPGKAPELRE